MDLVTIFSYGWNQIPNSQRSAIESNIWEMLNYTLKYSLLPNGEFKPLVVDDTGYTAEYFGCAFLGRIGFFNEEKRFWTNATFPEAAAIKETIENYIYGELKKLGESDPTDSAYLLNALEQMM